MNSKIINNNEKIFSLLLLSLILFLYFIGFAYQENSAGGAIVDFENTKRNIITFKNNSFFEAIKLTASTDKQIFQSTRAPGFYVFNKYLNPFTTEIRKFQGFITFFSLIIPLLLFLNLKLKYQDTKIYLLLLISSLILLSPYLRSSAFWGNEENFGIAMVGFSGLFLQLYFSNIKKWIRIFYLILLAIFSSLCVYSDQKLIVIPLISFIFVIKSNTDNNEKFLLAFLYLIFSLPFIYLINLWGNIVPTGDGIRRRIDFSINYHHIAYSVSIISFYLFPFVILIKNKKEAIANILNFKLNYFLSIIFFLILIYFFFYYDLEKMYPLGGGVFQRLTQQITENILFQKTLLTIIFIFSWILILVFINQKYNNAITLLILPLLSVVISPALFQEYFDPLIYFIILVYLDQQLKFSFKKIFFIFLYFFLLLIISYSFYNKFYM